MSNWQWGWYASQEQRWQWHSAYQPVDHSPWIVCNLYHGCYTPAGEPIKPHLWAWQIICRGKARRFAFGYGSKENAMAYAEASARGVRI